MLQKYNVWLRNASGAKLPNTTGKGENVASGFDFAVF
jgi:hypothetical protein